MKEGQRKEYKTLGPKQNGKISSHIQMALILKSIRKRMNYAWKKVKIKIHLFIYLKYFKDKTL